MEEESKTIAHQIGGVHTDVLRFGLPGVKSDIVGAHPLESSLQSVIPVSLSLFQFHVLILLSLSLPDLIIDFSIDLPDFDVSNVQGFEFSKKKIRVFNKI